MATTVLEPAQVPGVFAQAFHLMRSGRPGPVLIDLPFDVQLAEIDFDPGTYEPLPVYKPAATRAQIDRRSPCSTAPSARHRGGRGIINADAADLLVAFAELVNVPVIPTLMGWGCLPDNHPLMAGMAGLQTAHRYGNATLLESDFVLGIGNRWANRHTGGLETYRQGRTFVHVDIQPTQIGRVFPPDYGIVLRRPGRRSSCSSRPRRNAAGRAAAGPGHLGQGMPGTQAHDAAPHPLRRRADQAAAGL
jgi:tartronate-semialdehyde synthase